MESRSKNNQQSTKQPRRSPSLSRNLVRELLKTNATVPEMYRLTKDAFWNQPEELELVLNLTPSATMNLHNQRLKHGK